jgi:hypothetical protein
VLANQRERTLAVEKATDAIISWVFTDLPCRSQVLPAGLADGLQLLIHPTTEGQGHQPLRKGPL